MRQRARNRRADRVGLTGAWACFLVAVVFVRPQEFVPLLSMLPFLLVVLGVGLALALWEAVSGGGVTLRSSLSYSWLVWILWAFIPSCLRLGIGGGAKDVFDSLVTPSLFGLVIVVGAQNEKRLRALLVTVVLVATALSAVMIHQSQSDFQCVLLRKGEDGAIDFSNGKGDGRRCETSVECEKQPIERGAVYDCERVGMFDSFTTARGRVRWRGVLSDPNEVCLLLAISLMFAYGTLESKKQRYRLVTFLMLTALFGGVVVLTQSRSGLLVMLAVLAMVFVRRFGSRGLLVAATVGLPIFLFGGRSGAEADESTAERTQLLYAGLDMVKQFPVLGVGVGQYREHAWPPLTAHNSYLLPAAELGLLGQLAFGVVLFTAVKIPWRLGWRTHPGVSPEIVSLAVGVTFAYAGLLLGIVFLSMCYHPLLYVMFGISGALHGTAMRQMPGYRFRLTFGEIGLVFLMGLGSLLVTYTYVKLRLTS